MEEKGFRVCSECKDFPCPKFKKFFDTKEWYSTVVGNLQRIEKEGMEKLLAREVRRVQSLISCAQKQGFVHCLECKKWPCAKLQREPLAPA